MIFLVFLRASMFSTTQNSRLPLGGSPRVLKLRNGRLARFFFSTISVYLRNICKDVWLVMALILLVATAGVRQLAHGGLTQAMQHIVIGQADVIDASANQAAK